jgi:hypothetical protein
MLKSIAIFMRSVSQRVSGDMNEGTKTSVSKGWLVNRKNERLNPIKTL